MLEIYQETSQSVFRNNRPPPSPFWSRFGLFNSEIDDVEANWINWLRSRSFGRADAGVERSLSPESDVRFFAFVYGDLQGSTIERGFAGGGVTYRNRQLLGSKLALDVTLDYGCGMGQKADLDLGLSMPLGWRDAVLAGGVYNVWFFQDGDEINSLCHVAYLLLETQLFRNLRITFSLEGAYDHAIVRQSHPQGTWLAGNAGMFWSF